MIKSFVLILGVAYFMETQEKENTKTQERILRVACDVFAEKGFRTTTVRDICRQAEVNIAAVN